MALFPAELAKQGAQRGPSQPDAALLSRESRALELIPFGHRRSTTTRVFEIGDEQVGRDARVETRICALAGTEGQHVFVAACVPEGAAPTAK